MLSFTTDECAKRTGTASSLSLGRDPGSPGFHGLGSSLWAREVLGCSGWRRQASSYIAFDTPSWGTKSVYEIQITIRQGWLEMPKAGGI